MASADFKNGIVYSPTWPGWSPPYANTGPQAQFSDADFYNVSFQALWNNGTDSGNNQYRDDLGTIGSYGFGLIRLYNWGQTRGWNGTTGKAHLGFLDYAQSCGLQVMVPVSNYFLSDDTYAWNGAAPDASYSFASAPAAIQAALTQFIGSIVANGGIHPAVHSISVGNEIDINTLVGQGNSGPVAPAARLARVVWWIVNLQYQISLAKYRFVLLTSPISNADQGNPPPPGASPLSYWFGAILNGVSADTLLPQGTTGGSSATFGTAVGGVGSTIGYNNLWYFNSVNIYQYGAGLAQTLGQYDKWVATTTNSTNWPGEQFSMPLLLTEIGVTRASNDAGGQEQQFMTITTQIAGTIKSYVAGTPNTLLAGYCIYEFNDETTLNANWGIYMVEPDSNPGGNVLYQEATGTTEVSYASWPSTNYPVNQFYPVTNTQNQTLIAALQQIFA